MSVLTPLCPRRCDEHAAYVAWTVVNATFLERWVRKRLARFFHQLKYESAIRIQGMVRPAIHRCTKRNAWSCSAAG